MASVAGQWLGRHGGQYVSGIIPGDQTGSSRDQAPLTPGRSYLRLWLLDAKLSGDQGIAVVHSQVTARFDDQDTTLSRVTPPVSGPLTEPIPFSGGTVLVEASILDLPGSAFSRTAADALIGYSELVTAPLSRTVRIAEQVVAGARNLLAHGQATVRVSLRQTFDEAGVDGPRLRPCHLAVVKARPGEFDAARLAVVDDRLYYAGENQVPGPLDGYDYLLLRIEGLAERADWRLPDIDGPFRRALEYASQGDLADADAYRTMALAVVWRSPDLSVPDRRRVFQAIEDELTGIRSAGLGATGGRIRDLTATMAVRAMPVRQAAAQGALLAAEVFGVTPGTAAQLAAPASGRDVAVGRSRPEGAQVRTRGLTGGPGLLGLGEERDPPVTRGSAPRSGSSEPSPGDRSDQRFFRADLEDLDDLQPLGAGLQYTIAFSVALSDAGALAASEFADEVLAAADPDVTVFDLTVQLDSDDFEIYGQSLRPLRVPRTGRSLGKARFDISPRHAGACRLTATVHNKGNFVQQIELTIPVGDRRPQVEISTRGRSPGSVAVLKPRDISIILEPGAKGGFSCTAIGSVAGRTTLPITDNELASAVTAAREAMMQVILLQHDYEAVFQEAIDIPAEAGEEALRTLAEAGADLFQKLFLHPAGGADAKAVGRWLRDYATDPTLRLTFQVVAHEAPIPWALLYLGDASEDAELDWNNFLGMRHIVEQLPLQTSLSTRNYEIPSKPSLAVSLNVNTSIDADLGITLVEEHQQYWADTAVGLDDLDLVTRSTRREVVAALKNPQTSDRIVYFYCHATAGDPAHANPDEAAIIMSQGDVLRLDYLNRNASTEIQLAGNPLVFINACESAELSPLFYNGFVPYFMAKGARGVIGTECKTPALFAIEWANEFFKRFLDGKAVGETVLQLRQDFLREHNNPLGLIYAIHCDADTRITPALARSS
jgi:hypothetical protein